MTPVYSSFGLETYFYDEDTGTFHFPPEGICLTPVSAAPSGLVDGQIWYDSTLDKFRARQNGATVDMIGGSGSTPTGTGFRHVTSGTEDGAARYQSEAETTFTDITTNDSSTSKHGYLKKLSNVSTEFMNGVGSWATPSGGAMTLIGTATVSGSAATVLTLSSLDLSSYKAFYVFIALENATVSDANISLFYNSDTTATNYHRQRVSYSNAAVGAARENNAIIDTVAGSECSVGQLIIANDRDGKPRANSVMNRGAVTALGKLDVAHAWTSATNITGITLSSSVANSLAIGSTFSVFGIV